MKRLLAFLLISICGTVLGQERVTVLAAASVKNALDEASAAYGAPVVASYAASSALARQVERGAPAHVFISADEEWMDYLEKRALLAPGTRRDLLGNRLVWIAPAGSAAKADDPLAMLGPRDRLALADPQHVPAGKYARAALEKMGRWHAVAGRVAAAENVRAALALVARGEAPLGIVYETDARAEPKVRVVQVIDARLHPSIVYPAAALRGSGDAARRYLEFLASGKARAIFAKHGFSAP